MVETKFKKEDFVEIILDTGGDAAGTVTMIEEVAGWCPASSPHHSGHIGYWVSPIATGRRDAQGVPVKNWYQSEETLKKVVLQ